MKRTGILLLIIAVTTMIFGCDFFNGQTTTAQSETSTTVTTTTSTTSTTTQAITLSTSTSASTTTTTPTTMTSELTTTTASATTTAPTTTAEQTTTAASTTTAAPTTTTAPIATTTVLTTTASTTIQTTTITVTTNIQVPSDYLIDESAFLHGYADHWYEFNLTEAGYIKSYTLGMTDTFGLLYDSNYNLLLDDDDNGFDVNFLMEGYLEAGTYYIIVQGYDEEVEGDYRIIVDYIPESEMTHLLNETGTLEVNATDRYTIVVTEPGTLTAFTIGPTDTLGILYTSDENDLMEDDDSGIINNFMIQYHLEPGTYYLDVAGNNEYEAGAYQLFVDFDIDSQTNHLLFNQGYLESLETDRYEVVIAQAGYLNAYTVGSLDTFGSIYSEDGTLLAEDDDGGFLTNFQVGYYVTPGRYFIDVEGYDDSVTGDYTMIVDLRPDDELVNIHFMSNDAYLESNEVDQYEITITETGYITVFTVGELDTYGELFASDSSLIFSDDDSGSEYNFLIMQYVTPGTYYVDVSGYDELEVGDYRIIVDFAIENSTDYHYYFSQYGTLSTGETGTYQISVSGPGTLSVYTLSSLDTYGYLYTSDGTLLGENDDGYFEYNFSITYSVLTGTYTIEVNGIDETVVGPYLLIIDFIPDDN